VKSITEPFLQLLGNLISPKKVKKSPKKQYKCRTQERRFAVTYSGKQAKIMENFIEFLAEIEVVPRNVRTNRPLKQEFIRIALDHVYWHYRELFRKWWKGEEIEVPTKGLNDVTMDDDDIIREYPTIIEPLEIKENKEVKTDGKKTND
jgi:hypothetical protein